MTIPWQHLRALNTFSCPSCSSRLRVKPSFYKANSVLGFLLGAAVAVSTGATGWSLALMAFLLGWPGVYFCGFVVPKVLGIPLEAVPNGGRVALGESNEID
jgi:hypothetical protein